MVKLICCKTQEAFILKVHEIKVIRQLSLGDLGQQGRFADSPETGDDYCLGVAKPVVISGRISRGVPKSTLEKVSYCSLRTELNRSNGRLWGG